MASTIEIADVDRAVAFGERLGIDVPTRYGTETHAAVDALMAVDCLLTPLVMGMSKQTVLLCQLLAGGLLLLRQDKADMTLRRRLEVEAMIGLVLIVVALRGTITRRALDRAYLLIGGVMMISNSLMTESN